MSQGTGERASTRQWMGLAVLVLPCVLASMDLSVRFVALPSLSADIRPSSSQLLWIMDSYGFLLAGLLVTMGTVGGRATATSWDQQAEQLETEAAAAPAGGN